MGRKWQHQARIAKTLVLLITAFAAASALAGEESREKKLKKSCDGGQAPDCYTLGKSYATGEDVEKNPKKAADSYKKACELALAQGCLDLAAMQRAGEGIAKDVLLAVTNMKRACDLKDDTDLGERLVTVAVGELPARLVTDALDHGAVVADELLKRDLILGAALALQGQWRTSSCAGLTAPRQTLPARCAA